MSPFYDVTARRRVGTHYGPNQHPYIPVWCAYEVSRPFCGSPVERIYYQCQKPPGHGPAGLYCKQHAKTVEAGE